MSYLSCACHAFASAALWSPAGKGLTSWLSLLMFTCDFVTFPYILKDFKNAPPAEMLIYVENLIFSLCEK